MGTTILNTRPEGVVGRRFGSVTLRNIVLCSVIVDETCVVVHPGPEIIQSFLHVKNFHAHKKWLLSA